MDRLMSPQELSQALQVPLGTLYQWRHRGIGPTARRVGRHLRYSEADVDRWLDEQVVDRRAEGA